MADIVNLRTARKQAKRRRAEQEAAQNRLAHGRSKAEKALQRSRSDNAQKKLDQHRIERKTEHEVAGHQALDRDRGTQDERQS